MAIGKKVALVVGTCTYHDMSFAKLAAPAHDVRGLAEALRDPAVGGFDDVRELVDRSSRDVLMEISNVFADREKDDLVVVYISGHGYKDRGRLYFVFSDTLRHRLNATAVAADFLKQEMEQSAARRQVLILDCCHAGAFSQGMKSGAGLGDKAGALEELGGDESGKIVLTASDAIQYAYEGDAVSGEAQHSVFTKHLLEGLRTGAADMDGDGSISVDELFDYVRQKVREERPAQKPQRSAAGESGDVFIARSQNIKPAALSSDLLEATRSRDRYVVMGSIDELVRLLSDDDPRMAAAARLRLGEMVNEDHFRSVLVKVEEALRGSAPGARAGRAAPEVGVRAAPKTGPATSAIVALANPPIAAPVTGWASPGVPVVPVVAGLERRTTAVLDGWTGLITFQLDGQSVEAAFPPLGFVTVKYAGHQVSSKIFYANIRSTHKFIGSRAGAVTRYVITFGKVTKAFELSSRSMKITRDGVQVYEDDGRPGLKKS